MIKHTDLLNKSSRILLVWESIRSLGKASPERVFSSVARKIGVDLNDKNLRRSIYRDLKSLADSGQLGVTYFTPDGAEISPDNETSYSNVRVEYYLVDSKNKILGQGILEKHGGLFFTSKHRTLKWRFIDLFHAKLAANFNLVIETRDQRYLVLQLPLEELPVKLVMGRNPGDNKLIPQEPFLSEILGLRYGLLYLSHQTLSRPSGYKKMGHAVIEVPHDGKSFLISDLGSKSGTQWALVKSQELEKLLDYGSPEMTMNPKQSISSLQLNWNPTKPGESYPVPCFVRMGGLFCIVC